MRRITLRVGASGKLFSPETGVVWGNSNRPDAWSFDPSHFTVFGM